MEHNDAILTFDTVYTTNEIQILKLALPLLSSQIQPYAALLIKSRELKYCLDRLPKTRIEHASLELSYLDAFLDNALPYCNEKQGALIRQLKQLKQSIDMFEKMKSMMSVFGDNDAVDITSLFQAFGQPKTSEEQNSPEDMLRSVMSGEQTEMFEQFKKKFDMEL